MSGPNEVLHEGRFLNYCRSEKGWEYVSRTNASGAVGILAVTEDDKVILVEQYRPPTGRMVIELPAGLAGDIPLQEEEPLLTAAKRELKEETGYEAKHWVSLSEGASSAGLCDEMVTLFWASGLTKMTEGGGVGDEDIRVHYVRKHDLVTWCRDQQAAGKYLDFKIFAALYLANSMGESGGAKLWY